AGGVGGTTAGGGDESVTLGADGGGHLGRGGCGRIAMVRGTSRPGEL
ncbi:unnamed protein product, partial [Allacma fusca]